jgi:hypothetical protein
MSRCGDLRLHVCERVKAIDVHPGVGKGAVLQIARLDGVRADVSRPRRVDELEGTGHGLARGVGSSGRKQRADGEDRPIPGHGGEDR